MATTQTAQAEHIRNCDDFQSLIPAYLSQQLTSARVMLFEDHTRECFACRKELKAARTATAPTEIHCRCRTEKFLVQLQATTIPLCVCSVISAGTRHRRMANFGKNY